MIPITRAALAMMAHEADQPDRISHFLKVSMYARLIAETEVPETADRQLIELAALTHDIGIRPSLEKYQSAAGPLQEKEGPPLARKMLAALDCQAAVIERVCWLIAHHHTYDPIEGLDHQILIEADFLVNAHEGKLSQEAIRQFADRYFKTRTGIKMLDLVFHLSEEEST